VRANTRAQRVGWHGSPLMQRWLNMRRGVAHSTSQTCRPPVVYPTTSSIIAHPASGSKCAQPGGRAACVVS
jgi:hypothetical protein